MALGQQQGGGIDIIGHATRSGPGGRGRGPRPALTCFVVTGFGNKTDHATGRVLNLDKTYEQLVQPACDAVDVNCCRAIDANLSGSIDSIMYRWIFQADLVIADLSTLNANVFHELGVRHAQRPDTTIIIAESVLVQRLPFDLSAFVVHPYEHGGEAIDAAEQQRFVAHLAEVMRKIIAGQPQLALGAPQPGPDTDSPVYTFLKDMRPPTFEAHAPAEPPAYIPPAQRHQPAARQGESLASIIDAAEAAKQGRHYAPRRPACSAWPSSARPAAGPTARPMSSWPSAWPW